MSSYKIAFWIVFTVAAFVGYTVTYRILRRMRRPRRIIRIRQGEWARPRVIEIADEDEMGIGA